MPEVSLLEPVSAEASQAEWYFSSMARNLMEVPAHRFPSWRPKRKRLSFHLAPSQHVDLGPWHGFGWPEADLPAASAHFDMLRRFQLEPHRAYYHRSVQVMGPQMVIGAGRTVISESTRGLGILQKSGCCLLYTSDAADE